MKTEHTDQAQRPLQEELNNRKTDFEKKAPEDKKKIYAEGLQALAESDLIKNALQVGDIAVNFTLKNAAGKNITLYDALKNGTVILMWYRGGWCPYCNMTLHHMQKALPDFKKNGASLLALTPEVPDNSISTKEKNELEFEVLSDLDNTVARKYNVVFKLTDDVAASYEASFGLSSYNGNKNAELPLAATYIIGQDKIIKYAFLDIDYRNRAEPKDLIRFLKEMK
ncbi:peroxiredoxin-like family protein [Flavobacterium tegetincola]|uniref:peroxiredoxin-like family protein n=1 Tax=Flavobacterium tegetincola TaxID=150172 RepID=UPI0003F6687E|nr:peroxiredoxin-like family protein [Flavobacterium tegetincola]